MAEVFLVTFTDWEVFSILAVRSTREGAMAVVESQRRCQHDSGWHDENPGWSVEQCAEAARRSVEEHIDIERWTVDNPELYDREILAVNTAHASSRSSLSS